MTPGGQETLPGKRRVITYHDHDDDDFDNDDENDQNHCNLVIIAHQRQF